MRIGGRGNDAAGTAKALLWRALPWVPVAWCVDDAVVSVRRIDRPGIKVVAALSGDFDDDRCREGAYAMLDKASYRYFSNVERGDVVCMPRPGRFTRARRALGTKRREGGQMEMQRVALKTTSSREAKIGRVGRGVERRDGTERTLFCSERTRRRICRSRADRADCSSAPASAHFLKIQRMEKKTGGDGRRE